MAALLERLAGTTAGQWYLAQQSRDQRTLQLLGAFIGLTLLYLLIWLPVQDAHTQARQRYARELADQQWILANFEALQQAVANRSGADAGGRALLGTVAGAARRAGLTLNRFQPEGEDALTVALDDVEFGALVTWLDALEREEGIRVRQANIDPQSRSGHVRARLVLY